MWFLRLCVPALLGASDRGEAGGKAQRETYSEKKNVRYGGINLALRSVYRGIEKATYDILMLNDAIKDVILNCNKDK